MCTCVSRERWKRVMCSMCLGAGLGAVSGAVTGLGLAAIHWRHEQGPGLLFVLPLVMLSAAIVGAVAGCVAATLVQPMARGLLSVQNPSRPEGCSPSRNPRCSKV